MPVLIPIVDILKEINRVIALPDSDCYSCHGSGQIFYSCNKNKTRTVDKMTCPTCTGKKTLPDYAKEELIAELKELKEHLTKLL